MRKSPLPIALFSLAALAFTAVSASAADEAGAPIKALYVTGGGFHDYDGQTVIVQESLAAHLPSLELIVNAVPSNRDAPAIHPAFEGDDWADGYDLVIYNMCNSGRQTDDDYVARIVAPHHAGLPAVVIHCTMHQFRPDETGKWNAFLGIESTAHERGAPVTVTLTKPDHPALAGLPETWSYPKGELYQVISEGDNVVPLAVGVSSEEVEHTIIWTNTYGEGRVFGTTIGHANETMLEEEFQTLLKNGILWALGRLDP